MMIHKNKKNGNILPITFILLTALTVIVGSFAFLSGTTIKKTSADTDYIKCLYIAEAGIAYAVWNLKTPTYQGGRGHDWRTSSMTENFGGGSVNLKVEDGSTDNEIKITSRGTLRDITRSIEVLFWTYPPAFEYALYSKKNTVMNSNSRVSGYIFADANVLVNVGAQVINGSVMVTEGHVVYGGGSYIVEPPPTPLPDFPSVNTSYYDAKIATAAAKPYDSKTYYFFKFLNNKTIYVNGNVTINAVIIGPGEIVATGNITVNRWWSISDNVNLIANNTLTLKRNTYVGDNSTLYGENRVDIMNDVYNERKISVLSPNDIYVYDGAYISGIINAENVHLEPYSTVVGCVMSGNTGTETLMKYRARIYYYDSKFPTSSPPGIPSADSVVPGSWKEIP